MLSELERRFAALLGDGLAGRTHLTVTSPPAPAPGAGRGTAVVSIAELTAEPGFAPDQFALTGAEGPPRSRRVLPVQFVARVDVLERPQGPGADAQAQARALLLDDLSHAAHLLDDPAVRGGAALAPSAGDAGYRVIAVQFLKGTIRPDLAGEVLNGALEYRGAAELWPAGVSQAEGEILAVDAVLAALPLEFALDDTVVPVGGTTRLRVKARPGTRLLTVAAGERAPLRLAVAVVSDLPQDRRGSIPAGTPGVEAGFRLLEVAEPATVIPYQAPAGDPGAVELETVAVHLARPDGRAGVFLGSAVVRLGRGGA